MELQWCTGCTWALTSAPSWCRKKQNLLAFVQPSTGFLEWHWQLRQKHSSLWRSVLRAQCANWRSCTQFRRDAKANRIQLLKVPWYWLGVEMTDVRGTATFGQTELFVYCRWRSCCWGCRKPPCTLLSSHHPRWAKYSLESFLNIKNLKKKRSSMEGTSKRMF